MTGQKIGYLTVLSRAENKGTNAAWLCHCSACGREKVMSRPSLRNGSKSCGCKRGNQGIPRPSYRCHTPKGQSAQNRVLKAYKESARHRKLAWDLTRDLFFELVQRPCWYCGEEPRTVSAPSKNGIFIHNGLDRTNNKIGYTPSNVVPCCPTCNHAKHTMTQRDFLAWIQRAARHLEGS